MIPHCPGRFHSLISVEFVTNVTQMKSIQSAYHAVMSSVQSARLVFPGPLHRHCVPFADDVITRVT